MQYFVPELEETCAFVLNSCNSTMVSTQLSAVHVPYCSLKPNHSRWEADLIRKTLVRQDVSRYVGGYLAKEWEAATVGLSGNWDEPTVSTGSVSFPRYKFPGVPGSHTHIFAPRESGVQWFVCVLVTTRVSLETNHVPSNWVDDELVLNRVNEPFLHWNAWLRGKAMKYTLVSSDCLAINGGNK